ncbi:hypothetical protein F8388_008064 [Cannabis sativa]|uniref:Uncharacterized protein n=1 Tax=Cannabis sativa TaxID=3483 RepID=A0A7J6DXM2_CANSA|nr:hypothetical protein F8388_008064 [Cannabis sativa]
MFFNTARYYRAYYGYKTVVKKLTKLVREVGDVAVPKSIMCLNYNTVLIGLLLDFNTLISGQGYRYGQEDTCLLLWCGHWFRRYKVKKAPYTWDDVSYLTQRALRVHLDSWVNMDDATKEDLLQRGLWEQSNLEAYFAEMRKESKSRR